MFGYKILDINVICVQHITFLNVQNHFIYKLFIMPHSLCHQYIHVVFGTKNLQNYIHIDAKNPLLAYMLGIIKELDGFLINKSSHLNHVHLLINLPTNLSLTDLIRQVKSSSSKWYRKSNSINSDFNWEEGYAAFTVSHESLKNVDHYFLNEEKRHSKSTYEIELTRFLNIHGIKYKPEYLTKTTYSKLIFHIVWSVKNRETLLDRSTKQQLHDCIKKNVNELGCEVIAIENVTDHIHILVECKPTIAISHLVQKLKTSASSLLNKHISHKFSWQEGFGSFSVGITAHENVINYIKNQERHHNHFSYDDEFGKILKGELGV